MVEAPPFFILPSPFPAISCGMLIFVAATVFAMYSCPCALWQAEPVMRPCYYLHFSLLIFLLISVSIHNFFSKQLSNAAHSRPPGPHSYLHCLLDVDYQFRDIAVDHRLYLCE